MRPLAVVAPFLIAALGFAGAAAPRQDPEIILPSGWVIQRPPALWTSTGTMPQGAAFSPNGRRFAALESGFNSPALRVYDARSLKRVADIPLSGGFGRPLWLDPAHVLVAGANAEAILVVDTRRRSVQKIPFPPRTFPIAVARHGSLIAVATDDDGAVRIGTLSSVARAKSVRIGTHPGGLAFSPDGATLYAADRSGEDVKAVTVRDLTVRTNRTRLHPTDLLISGNRLFVAESDADRIGVYRLPDFRQIAQIFVGDAIAGKQFAGVSPNALALSGDTLYVSLGAANSVAVVRNARTIGRIPAGRYPTDVLVRGDRLFIVNGKGEGAAPNPQFDVYGKSARGYVAAIEFGSIRVYSLASARGLGNPQGAAGRQERPEADTVLRANGPIRHVFFILKENRTYDQILGDLPQANGDPRLALFGERVTPNQHALAKRFGIFDNAYASGEVSDAGHDWADAAMANDYVERVWPPAYGGRADGDDTGLGSGAATPANGYIWDAAARARVSFRDYGEMVNAAGRFDDSAPVTAPTLGDRYDPKYVGWNLRYSDLDRYREWDREFNAFVRGGNLPRFEYIWLPNDHTSGSKPGAFTPAAYVAVNDYAVGRIVAAISHSAFWKSSAIFITEDDAQDGADHVSDQRTTLFLASPYARGGLRDEHYSTVSALRTMEILLGIEPLSSYDATAVPLYAAFTNRADLRPYDAIAPRIDVTARNRKIAYGAAVSAAIDFSRPDAARSNVLRDIVANNAEFAATKPRP